MVGLTFARTIDLEDIEHAWHFARFGIVKGRHPGVQHRAALHDRVAHSRHFGVNAIARLSGDDIAGVHHVARGSYDLEIVNRLQRRGLFRKR